MNRVAIFAAAVLLAGYQAPALAQGKAKEAASESLTKDQKDHAVEDFGVLSSAIRSDKVPDDVKAALMGCIYSNSLGKISAAIDEVVAKNPGKVDRKNPDSILGAMAAICGYKPNAAATTPPSGQKAPAGR
jgi:hypothetical protein